jgi:acyl carrier protein
MTTTASRIREIVAEQLCLDMGKVTEHESLTNAHGMDSLDRVEIVITLEDEFDIDIPDERMEKFDTVWQLIEVVEEMI